MVGELHARWQRCVGALLFVLVLVAGCGGDVPLYHGTLAEWQRDSAVVDSLARLVPTDPLYHAYHGALTASDLNAAHQLIACFHVGLASRHGSYPASIATQRMRDTLWKGVAPSLIAEHDARVPAAMDLAMDGEECADAESVLGPVRKYDPVADAVDPRHRPRGL